MILGQLRIGARATTYAALVVRILYVKMQMIGNTVWIWYFDFNHFSRTASYIVFSFFSAILNPHERESVEILEPIRQRPRP